MTTRHRVRPVSRSFDCLPPADAKDAYCCRCCGCALGLPLRGALLHPCIANADRADGRTRLPSPTESLTDVEISAPAMVWLSAHNVT